jgi:hypothetical protein
MPLPTRHQHTQTHTHTRIATYQSRQRHASHRAHQFDRLTIVDVAVPDRKLLSFRLLIIHCTKADRNSCFCLPFSYLALIEPTVNTDACQQGADRAYGLRTVRIQPRTGTLQSKTRKLSCTHELDSNTELCFKSLQAQIHVDALGHLYHIRTFYKVTTKLTQ